MLNLQERKLTYIATQYPFVVIWSKDDMKVDPEQIKAIQNMPRCSDAKAVLRFTGSISYLIRFLPNLTDMLLQIRSSTKKSVEWKWDNIMKRLSRQSSWWYAPLWFFSYCSQKKEPSTQSDSSQHGLGAVLLENEQLIDCRSKPFRTAETRYAQIDKELLEVIFTLKKIQWLHLWQPKKTCSLTISQYRFSHFYDFNRVNWLHLFALMIKLNYFLIMCSENFPNTFKKLSNIWQGRYFSNRDLSCWEDLYERQGSNQF